MARYLDSLDRAGPSYDYDDMDVDDAKKMRLPEDDDYFEMSRPAGQSNATDVHQIKENINWDWAQIKDIESLDAFNSDAIKHLKGLSEFSYNHQEVAYHICYFIEEEVRNDPDSYYPTDAEQLESDLDYLAFTETTAEKVVKCIANRIMCTQNASFWATNFVRNWVLCNQEGKYKYKPSIQDIFFDQKFTKVRGQNGIWNLERTIEAVNVNSDDTGFWDLDNTEIFQYFHHGTDWGSVESIVQDGIILNGDEFGKDFSFRDRPGFYVSDKFEDAKEWAKSKAACPAVIVFKVENNLFSDNSKHLDLINADDEFKKKVYTYHRSRGHKEVGVEAEVKGLQTIKGPVLLNPKGVICDDEAPQLSDDLHMCILDSDIASQFHSSICLIVYFEKREM